MLFRSDQLVSKKAGPLVGAMPIPGDKSISHRSLIFSSLAIGTTKVCGLLEGADVMSTKNALVALGAGIKRDADGVWHITGVGLHGMISPLTPLDLGNSGTGARLLARPSASASARARRPRASSSRGASAARARTPVCKSNLQPDFNVRVCECFDTSTSAVLRELAKSNRFVQKSAESTSI